MTLYTIHLFLFIYIVHNCSCIGLSAWHLWRHPQLPSWFGKHQTWILHSKCLWHWIIWITFLLIRYHHQNCRWGLMRCHTTLMIRRGPQMCRVVCVEKNWKLWYVLLWSCMIACTILHPLMTLLQGYTVHNGGLLCYKSTVTGRFREKGSVMCTFLWFLCH